MSMRRSSGASELRVAVDPEFLERLQSKLDQSPTELSKTAFTVLNWVVDEVSEGRVILSAKPDGSDVRELSLPELSKLSRRLASR